MRTREEISPPVLLSYYRAYAWKCEIAAQNAPNEKQRDELKKKVRVWRDFAAQHERAITVGDGRVDALIPHALWLDVKTFGA